MNTAIHIANHTIGPEAPPFIIAEMSGNHNGSLSRALKIVDAAAKAGAHALKIQTYTADTMTLNSRRGHFVIRNPKSPWNGSTLYDLYKKAYTPWEWHPAIFKRCRKHGMVGFSTPFDATAVDFLESLRVPVYKIASFENIDIPLIRRVAQTGKPMIISTGMASVQEVQDAVQTARANGCRQLMLLKCTSAYPASPSDSHLNTLKDLAKRFRCVVGLSDHTLGIAAAVASVAMGARLIEKHVTLSRAEGGVDSAFSLEPAELAQLVEETERARQSLGGVHYGPTTHEAASLKYRRSIYFVRDMKVGEAIAPDAVRCIRPGDGLAPKEFDRLIGKRVKRPIRAGTPVRWSLIR